MSESPRDPTTGQFTSTLRLAEEEASRLEAQLAASREIIEQTKREQEVYAKHLAEVELTRHTRVVAALTKTVLETPLAVIIERLYEQGVTCLTGTSVDAREVLTQALEIITNSYWIAGIEVRGDGPVYETEDLIPADLKHLTVKAMGGYIAVTGACSVGAISLAASICGKQSLSTYGDRAVWDSASRVAAEALAWAIHQKRPYSWEHDTAAVSAIVNWNDHDCTKQQAIAMFTLALEAPILNGDGVYYPQGWDGVTFGTRAEAEEFIAGLAAGQDWSKHSMQVVVNYANSHYNGSRGIMVVEKWEPVLEPEIMIPYRPEGVRPVMVKTDGTIVETVLPAGDDDGDDDDD